MGDIDPPRIAFVGQSLGSIVGITFGASLPTPTTLPYPTATPLRVPTLALSVPGGGVAALLRDSPTFGPRINAGLAQLGLMPGTSLYAQFFRDVQNIIDAGDPLNYVTNIIFWLKMLAMVLAAVNALAFHFITEYTVVDWDAGRTPPSGARLAGWLSIILWVNVILAGRLMPYALTWFRS